MNIVFMFFLITSVIETMIGKNEVGAIYAVGAGLIILLEEIKAKL